MPSVWVHPFAESSYQDSCCGVTVNDRWADAPGGEGDPLESGELAWWLADGGRIAQVELRYVAFRRRCPEHDAGNER